MKSKNSWLMMRLMGVMFGVSEGYADEFVEMGEYVSGAAVHGGKRGHFSGNNQKMVFKDSKGDIVWSSGGGWTNGAQKQISTEEAVRTREEMREQKSREDREVRAGRRNPEFGEYVKGGATFHGYSGHWSGNNQKSVFVSKEYGIIYSSQGGWVDGFGPEFETVRSKWGAGISDDAQVYASIADPNTVRRTASLEANQLYMVIEANRRFVTVAYEAGGRTVLANRPLSSGTLVPGSMIGQSGEKYKFVTAGNGFRFDPQN